MARQRLSKAQAKAYVAHWRAARMAEIFELRAMTPELKLRQVAALMLSADALGWTPGLKEEVAAARERWDRLRSVYASRA